MQFAKQRKKQSGIKSLGDYIKSTNNKGGFDKSKVVKGMTMFDKFERPMLRGDVSGVLAPSGAGKTTFLLNDASDTLTKHDEGVVVMFALEQDSAEIAEKWMKLNEDDPETASRFYVFSNFDEDENMSVADIKFKLSELKEVLGVDVLKVYIDHLHLIRHNHSDFNPVCQEIKTLAKSVNTHIFVVSQTQKANQIVDVPVPRTGCYNCSQYEWIMTNIISIFQPLYRVKSESGLEILGYQFCKIRYKNKKDSIKEGMNYLLSYNHDTERLTELTNDEKSKFELWYDKVLELRQNEEKYKSFQFDLSTTIKGKDGGEVHLRKVVGGGNNKD